MGLKKNNPGCGCCGCTTTCYDCTAGSISTTASQEVELVVSGLPVDFTAWRRVVHAFGDQYEKFVIYDFNTAEGTYSITPDADCFWSKTFTPVSLSYDQWILNVPSSGCPTSNKQSGTTNVEIAFQNFGLSVAFPGLHDYVTPTGIDAGWFFERTRSCGANHACDYEDWDLVVTELNNGVDICVAGNRWSGTDSTFI